MELFAGGHIGAQVLESVLKLSMDEIARTPEFRIALGAEATEKSPVPVRRVLQDPKWNPKLGPRRGAEAHGAGGPSRTTEA